MTIQLHDAIAYPKSLATATLSAPADATLTRDRLAGLVAELARDTHRWRTLVQHDTERRWWTRLVRHELVDAWLITWPGQGATDLHDHGRSAAALTVVEGTLQHVLASRTGELSRETLATGTLLSVAPHAVHDVRNPTRIPAVSIHAYSPPLKSMTYFRPDGRGLQAVRTVHGDAPEMEQPW